MRPLIALILTLISVPTFAQNDYHGPYVGLGIAQIDYETNFLLWFDVDEADVVPRLIAGFRFSDKFAFEAVYNARADFTDRMAGNVPIFLDSNGDAAGGAYTANYTGNFESVEIRVLAHAGNKMVFGVGLFSSSFKGQLIGSTPPISPYDGSFEGRRSDDDNGYVLIIGAQIDVGNWGIRPAYEYFGVSSPADATSLSVQFTYGF
jgi:hypothetical protein